MRDRVFDFATSRFHYPLSEEFSVRLDSGFRLGVKGRRGTTKAIRNYTALSRADDWRRVWGRLLIAQDQYQRVSGFGKYSIMNTVVGYSEVQGGWCVYEHVVGADYEVVDGPFPTQEQALKSAESRAEEAYE